MIGTLGQGPRTERLAADVTHIVASAVGGAVAGGILAWTVGLIPLTPGGDAGLLAVVAGAYGAMEAGLVRLPLPQTGRQVPASWRYRFARPVTAGLYGALLGTGVGTRVADAAFVGVLAGAAVLGGPVAGGVVLGTFGLVRGASSVVAAHKARGSCERAILTGYRMGPVWRVLGIVQLFVLAGAAAGVFVTR